MVVTLRPILQSGQAVVRWLVASCYDGFLENPLFCRPHVWGVQCDIHEASMVIPHMGQLSRLVKIAHGRKVRSLRRSSPWCGSAGPVCSTPSLFGGIPSDPGGSICARDPVHADASAFSRLDVGTIRNRRAVPRDSKGDRRKSGGTDVNPSRREADRDMRWCRVWARLATAGTRKWHVDSARWKRMDRRSCRKSLARFVEKFNEQSADGSVHQWNHENRRSDPWEEAHERCDWNDSNPTEEKTLFTWNPCPHRRALEIDPQVELSMPLLKNAFRKQALTCHPDVQTKGTCKRVAAERFHAVKQAYEVLTNKFSANGSWVG